METSVTGTNLFEKEINDVLEELCEACIKWDDDFDNQNTINDWITYINMYSSSAGRIKNTKEQQYNYLRKAAGLCLSAMRTCNRNNGFSPRHYD